MTVLPAGTRGLQACRVVAFDLDGTLLPGTSVSLMLAEHVGRLGDMLLLDRAFAAGEISNRAASERCADWFAGLTLVDVADVLVSAPWISGVAETVAALGEAGRRVLLATISWRFAADIVAERFGFEATCGAEMALNAGCVLSGMVTRFFEPEDKARFVEDWTARHGYQMSQVAAVGDARSDLPLFAAAGWSLALNASPDARAAAEHVIDTEDLRSFLALFD